MVSMMVIAVYITGLNRSTASMAQERAQKTSIALAQAKEALIAYAVTFADDPGHTGNPVPGFLPCPELAGTPGSEGVEASGCGSGTSRFISQIGRLPWRSLGLEAIKDGSGECLWYAVSGSYKNSPTSVITTSTATSSMMNWDTNGQFAVMAANGTTYLAGAAADNRAVAVIFAPGEAVSGQNRTPDANARTCGGNYSATAYLDQITAGGTSFNNGAVSAIANAITTFIAGDHSNTFNDRLVYITRADIWSAIKKRSDFQNNLRALTRRAAECIAMYGTENNAGPSDKRLPWAGNPSITNYAVNSRFRDVSGNLSGRLPYRVSVSVPATSSNSVATPFYLLSNASQCAYGLSPVNEQVWYDNWKEHLFYAIANNFRPTAAPGAGCGTCLTINGTGSYAAVVIFAGEKLSGQSRNINAEKALITNYLEGRNASNHPNAGGNSDYEAALSSGAFNDIVFGLDANLRIRCLSSTSNTMVLAPIADPSPLSPPAAPPHFPAGGATPPPGPYAACP